MTRSLAKSHRVSEQRDVKIHAHPQKWGRTEPKRTVTCMVLKVTVNDMRTFILCRDEFRGLRSDIVRQVALVKTRRDSFFIGTVVAIAEGVMGVSFVVGDIHDL
ncbi:hypothetical protein TNCV_4573211 [Trichonephila clavipes]|nr:hypothetical protein TNCV_4573211 [Trichonephila clavipes]